MTQQLKTKQYTSIHFADYLSGGSGRFGSLWTEPAPIVGGVDLGLKVLPPRVLASGPTRTQSDDLRRHFLTGMSNVCRQMLGVEVERAEFPGGPFRSSC